MKIFALLNKFQDKQFGFRKTQEYAYYKKNKKYLKTMPKLKRTINVNSSFSLICTNIYITTIINKIKIDEICKDAISSIYLKDKFTEEEFLKYYHARIIDLKSFVSNDTHVFVPFFSHIINNIYYNEPYKLLNEPYNILFDQYTENLIDPFECYSHNLFDSLFTKLIKIKQYGQSVVFYHFDLATIFVINDQGRLDAIFPIFDKWLTKIKTSHVAEKIEKVTDLYFANDKKGFIDELFNQEFISQKMHDLLIEKCL
ncbi:MAG: hypothetical protein RSE56_00270 [Bacilli bacterium]